MTNKQKTEEFNKDLIKLTNLGVNAGEVGGFVGAGDLRNSQQLKNKLLSLYKEALGGKE